MMYLRPFNRFLLISLALLGLSVSSQVQAGIVSYTDSGWWDSTGYSTDASFSNYVAGQWNCTPTFGCDPTRLVETRNFFVFDLTELKGGDPVTSATLRLSPAAVGGFGGTYSIWDVDSTMPELRRPLETDANNEFILRPEVYDDLGEGDPYGSIDLAPTAILPGAFVDIDLALALASINAKDGCTPGATQDCLWAIGGSYEATPFFIDIPPIVFLPQFDFAFGNSGGSNAPLRQLIYSTEPISAVPVPAAVWLFGTALIGLVGFGKRISRIAA